MPVVLGEKVFSSPLPSQPSFVSMCAAKSGGATWQAENRLTKHPEANVACSTADQLIAWDRDPKYSPPSAGVAFSALLIAAGTVGLGGALRGIFTAGDEDNEDRKLRSIQGLSGSILPLN
jgi:hypothetical protein